MDPGQSSTNGFDNLINVDESGNLLNGNTNGTGSGLKENKIDSADPIPDAKDDVFDVEHDNNETGKFLANETEKIFEGASTPGLKGDHV